MLEKSKTKQHFNIYIDPELIAAMKRRRQAILALQPRRQNLSRLPERN